MGGKLNKQARVKMDGQIWDQKGMSGLVVCSLSQYPLYYVSVNFTRL